MTMPPASLREVSRGFGSTHSGMDLMAPLGQLKFFASPTSYRSKVDGDNR